MGKKLAIKGHPTRGKEVVELLEMLGGVAAATKGFRESYCYYISEDTATKYISWDYIGPEEIEKYKIFTLEEFLEKYPFKVGDKVVYTKFGDNCDDYPVTIESMKWTGTTIEYTFNDCVTCLAKDLKMWNGEPDAVISGIHLNSYDYADEVELNLGDYEIEVRNGRTFAVLNKSKYPNTFEECCEVIGISRHDVEIDLPQPYQQKMFNLFKILIYRDAYWKIAGEQMGLGKPWEPKFGKYILYSINFYLYKDSFVLYKGEYNSSDNRFLVFPTEEMRDAFYENFNNLIEQCKELL